MHDVSIVQFDQPPQTCLEDLLPGSRGDRFPHQTKEVVLQVPVHEDSLVGDGVAR